MKKNLFSGVILVFILLITLSFSFSDENEVVVEGIMAKVGDTIITRSDFEKRKEQFLLEMRETMDAGEYEKNAGNIDGSVMDDLINEALVEYRARELSIAIPEEAVSEAIERLKEENHIRTQEEFEMALSAVGLTEEELRKSMYNRFLRSSLLEREVKSKIILTDQEIKEYYEQHKEDYMVPPSVKIRQVFFQADKMEGEDIAKECHAVKQDLRNGTDFQEIVKKYSEIEEEDQSDVLGPFKRGDLREEIEEVAFGLEPEEISDVIETQDGCFFIQLVEKDEGGYKPVIEVGDEISETIYKTMANEGIEEYLEKLKKEIYVEVLFDS